jgi:predicted dienelactone hydrolase
MALKRLAAHAVLALLCVLSASSAAAADAAAGFEAIRVPYGDEAALQGGVWYPAASAGDRLPLVVISHGGGGSYDGHEDTAEALARAGFVVAAVSHAGDTYDDESRVLELWRRPDQLRRLISFMLTAWRDHDRLDPRRVGAFGFSNGGFTVLVAAGGVPDLTRTEAYCADHPSHDLCTALAAARVSPRLAAGRDRWIRDDRIRAAVVAAPAFGFAFDKEGLRTVTSPVQLWGGALDGHQPPPGYEDAVAAALPTPPEFHRVPGAGHYDFLPPCRPALAKIAPNICASSAGFDRAAFHQAMNDAVVAFFSRTLAPARRSSSAPAAR